jgi:hypothetical protein
MKIAKVPFFTSLTPQYIIDKSGKKTAVILDIDSFEKLLEEIEDIYFGSLAKKALKKEELLPHKLVKRKHSGK